MTFKQACALAALLALAACETPPPAQTADGAVPPKPKGTIVTGSRLGSRVEGSQPDVQTLSGTGVQDAARGHPGSPFGPQ